MTDDAGQDRQRRGDGFSVDGLRQRRSREDPEAAARWERTEPRRRLALGLLAMRRRAGLSQNHVAQAAGWNQTQVARMESATGPWPTPESLNLYVRACGSGASVALVLAHPEQAGLHVDTVIAFGDRPADAQLEALAGTSLEPGD